MARKLIYLALATLLMQCCLAGVITNVDNFTPSYTEPIVCSIVPGVGCTSFSIDQGNDTIGVERDVIVTVLPSDLLLQASVLLFASEWRTEWDQSIPGYSQIQYDGNDTSTALTLTPGLNGLDLTNGLSASAFFLTISSDHPAPYLIEVYGSSTSVRSSFFFYATNSSANPPARFNYLIPFSSFTGNANFRSVNAIVITMNTSLAQGTTAIDTTVATFATFGYLVSGFAWFDCNNNGTFDNGESVFPGATATLLSGVNVVATTTTGIDGTFVFAGLLNGTFSVCVRSTGFTNTAPTTGCRSVTLQNFNDATGLQYGLSAPTVVTAPPSTSVPCGGCISTDCLGVATVTGCGLTPPTPTSVDSNSTTNCPKVITRTWSAPGTTSTSIQRINITDNVAPDITKFASDANVNCLNPSISILTWINTHAGANATDCTGVQWFDNWNRVTPGPCSTTTVTFNATDPCGNVNKTTATYTVTDTTPPSFTAPNARAECNKNGADITAFNSWLTTAGNAIITDDCSASNRITLTSNYTSGFTTGCNNQVFVRFNATDPCGNSGFSTANFTISDNLAPVITSPAVSKSSECTGLGVPQALTDWLTFHGNATATDQCNSVVNWSNNFDQLQLPTFLCNTAINVRFTATDPCLLSSSTNATYIVTDTQAPRLVTAASPVSIPCETPDIPGAFQNFITNHGGAFANDTCTINVSWTASVTSIPTSFCGSTSVTFTASDLCAVNPKSVQTTTTFTVTDNTKPVYTVLPTNVTSNCAGDTLSAWNDWLNTQGNSTVTDNCSTRLNLTNSNTLPGPPTGCNSTASVTFSATDACGNKGSAVGTFTVIDNTPPSFNILPTSPVVECSSTSRAAYVSWLTSNGGSNITDSCNRFTVTNNGPAAINNGCSVSQTVVFNATDICGRSSTAAGTFTIEDTLFPVISPGAQNRTVECDGAGNNSTLTTWLNTAGGATITDQCTSARITVTNDFTGFSRQDNCVSFAFVTFTASDGCGHNETTAAYFTIRDTTAPRITRPAQSQTVACSNTSSNAFTVWLESHANATAVDDCSGTSLQWSSNFGEETLPQCGATPVTFFATDGCGLKVNTSAVFTIFDNAAPVFSPGAQNKEVECDGYGNVDDYDSWVASMGGAVASDGCATTLFFNNTAPAAGPVGCGAVTVTFNAFDNCNNAGRTTATYTVVDTTIPDIDPPAQSVQYECDTATNPGQLADWLKFNANASATDSCSTIGFTHSTARLVPLTGCTESATVTFVATDKCGNNATTVGTFSIIDTVPPVITRNASNINIECSAISRSQILTWLGTQGNASAVESCSIVKWSNNFTLGEEQGSCSNPIPVTFTAADLCGNNVTTTATLTLTDTTSPIFVNFPEDLVLNCDECFTANCTGIPLAVDACSTSIPVSYSDDTSISPDVINCPGNYNIIRTFFAVDNCGNNVTKSQNIVVQITRTSGPCNPEECPPCDDTKICCQSPIPRVACNPVPCNPVACNPVACIRVPCTSVTAEDCGQVDNTPPPAAPLPYGGNIPEGNNCNPIYIYIFDDDDAVAQINYEYVYVDVLFSNSASYNFASLLLVVLSIFALL